MKKLFQMMALLLTFVAANNLGKRITHDPTTQTITFTVSVNWTGSLIDHMEDKNKDN